MKGGRRRRELANESDAVNSLGTSIKEKKKKKKKKHENDRPHRVEDSQNE